MISVESIWPGLLLVGLCLLVCEAVAARVPFYRRETAAVDGARYGTLDGVRGFLAFAVYLSHAASAHYWYGGRPWSWPPSVFYQMCGSVPVSLFFMITGFLFWKKAMRSPGAVDIRQLASSRLRRLAPLYLAALVPVLIAVGVKSGWQLRVPPGDLLRQVTCWAGLGVLGQPDINGVAQSSLFNTALWTLKYEWLFYATLPVASFLATPRRLPVAMGLWIGLVVLAPDHLVVLNFVVGMVLAQLTAWRPTSAPMTSRPAAAASVALLVLVGVLGKGDFGIGQTLLLAFPFAAIVYGNDLFGLLSTRSARLMGLVSYSLYVVHCLVLLGSLHLLGRFTAVGQLSPALYWVATFVIGVLVVLVSLVTYRFIEHPFMQPPSRVVPRAETAPPVRAAA